MTSGHAPTGMIADYAAGALSPGMSLLVASHLTSCPCCRDKAARLEALGGALLCEREAVPPGPRCLERALARIEAPPEAPAEVAAPAEARDPPLPRPLCRRLPPAAELDWEELAPGLSACWLDGFSERIGLIRAGPGMRVAAEAALVLAGGMRDGARSYGAGDLVLAADALEAAGDAPCLCLVMAPDLRR